MSSNKPTIDGRPVEIERKYLVIPPDPDVISSCEGYDGSFIEQMYITGEHGEGGRIRKRIYKDRRSFFYTIKQNINGLSRFETEYEISEDEYNRLSKLRLEGTLPVRKTRSCFMFKGQLFELDLYEFDESFATLEIELQSEEQKVELPDFIEIIAEVTGDRRYYNFSIAKNGRIGLS